MSLSCGQLRFSILSQVYKFFTEFIFGVFGAWSQTRLLLVISAVWKSSSNLLISIPRNHSRGPDQKHGEAQSLQSWPTSCLLSFGACMETDAGLVKSTFREQGVHERAEAFCHHEGAINFSFFPPAPDEVCNKGCEISWLWVSRNTPAAFIFTSDETSMKSNNIKKKSALCVFLSTACEGCQLSTYPQIRSPVHVCR